MRLVFLLLCIVTSSASADSFLESLVSKHSGCCSSHGGLSNRCQSDGRAVCNDGWLGSSCACHPHGGSSGGGSSSRPPSSGSGGSSSSRFVNLSGLYSGQVLVSRFEATNQGHPPLTTAVDSRKFRLNVVHTSKKSLRLTDEAGDTFRGSRITKDSFEVADLFDTEPDCILDVTYRLSRIDAKKATLHAVFDELCKSGPPRIVEFKGRLRRRPLIK